MIRHPPRYTLPDTPVPYTSLSRSQDAWPRGAALLIPCLTVQARGRIVSWPPATGTAATKKGPRPFGRGPGKPARKVEAGASVGLLSLRRDAGGADGDRKSTRLNSSH